MCTSHPVAAARVEDVRSLSCRVNIAGKALLKLENETA